MLTFLPDERGGRKEQKWRRCEENQMDESWAPSNTKVLSTSISSKEISSSMSSIKGLKRFSGQGHF
jgi:hypothetical protein